MFPPRWHSILQLKVIIQVRQRIGRNFDSWVLARTMLDKLVLSIVFNVTQLASVGLVIRVPTLVILAVSNSGEPFVAKVALVRLLSSMSPHVHE